MKYFYDTEFIEDGRTIDLISIGVVAEDGRELYLQNAYCSTDRANEWVRANVFPHLQNFDGRHKTDYSDGSAWRTPAEIAAALLAFVGDDKPELWAYCGAFDHVLISQLFKGFQNWPPRWPYHTNDIAQLAQLCGNPPLPDTNTKVHHALHDARWNKRAYEYLTGLMSK